MVHTTERCLSIAAAMCEIIGYSGKTCAYREQRTQDYGLVYATVNERQRTQHDRKTLNTAWAYCRVHKRRQLQGDVKSVNALSKRMPQFT